MDTPTPIPTPQPSVPRWVAVDVCEVQGDGREWGYEVFRRDEVGNIVDSTIFPTIKSANREASRLKKLLKARAAAQEGR